MRAIRVAILLSLLTATAVAMATARTDLRFGVDAAEAGSSCTVNFFDDHQTVALKAYTDLILEPPALLFHQGSAVDCPGTPGEDRFDAIEVLDRVAGTPNFPITWVDLIANTYFRGTYEERSGAVGSSALLGTSIIGSTSFRPAGTALRLIPSVTSAEVFTDLSIEDRIRIVLTAGFSSTASVESIRTYPVPVLGESVASLTVTFAALEDIALEERLLGTDAFRFVTGSTMFSTETIYDANVLRWEDSGGSLHVLRLTDTTLRDAHLLPAHADLGCWFELVKEPGSAWSPDSPSVRIDVADCEHAKRGQGIELGINGFLVEDHDPNSDSLNVWVEWLDAPSVIPAGTELAIGFKVTVTPPVLVTTSSTTSTTTSTSSTTTTMPPPPCAQPVNPAAPAPKASDCLFILRVAVGAVLCEPACVCAPTGSLPVSATDALLCLKKATGQDVALACCQE